MKLILETERLVTRQFTIDDTAFIIKLLNTPGWLQFIGDRNVRTEAEAKSYLENGPIKSFSTNGFGLGLVLLKSTNEAIGMCGLIKRETLKGVDIGFAFLPEFEGKGYAFEIAAATIKHAKEYLKLQVVLAVVLPQNTRSINLLKKIGLQFQKNIKLTADAASLMLFSTDNSMSIKE